MAQKTSSSLLTAFLLSTIPAVHGAAVVTTADNASPANDGQTSLLEALTNVQDNETITFNIPGAGPHYIVTPVTGYPLIEKSGVTIDGYSQPGSSPNTAAPDQPKNTQLRIILDSRTDQPAERRTALTIYDGFGESESCVLGFLNAPNALIRGLSFIGVSGQDNAEDPHVYCIALIEGSPGVKIQGCWFGLDAGKTSWAPGADGVVPGVHGARAAVASFKGNGLDSAGLIFGTDGDGANDRGEGNVCVAQRVAVHLATPQTRMSGNWINLFPDGSLLNLEKQALELEDGTLEAVENGDGTDMLIGTDGNGVSDAEESNRFGPVVYERFVEFWRPALNIVFAGNYAGMDLAGLPAFTSPGSALIDLRQDSSIRIGTDGDGTGDAAEANHIYGIGTKFLGLRDGITRISLRGNEISGSTGPIPYIDATAQETLFADILNDPAAGLAVVLDAGSTPAQISGTFPEPISGTPAPVIDFYLADASGLRQDPPSAQGRYWLGSFKADGPADLEAAAGKFKFDTSALALTAAELSQVTATASYASPSEPEQTVTTNFSDTLALPAAASPLGAVTITPAAAAGSYTLDWTGGAGPFKVLFSDSLTGPWLPLSTVNGQSATITPDFTTAPRRFYRIREGASPR